MTDLYGAVHIAQIAAIDWLISRCEDQFVRAWLVQERDLLQNMRSPIKHDGLPMNLSALKETIRKEGV